MSDAKTCLGGRQLQNVKRKLAAIICVFALLPAVPAMAQNCQPQDDISLNTQLEINSFQNDHGPCDTIVGILNINRSSEVDNIVNLDGLSGLTRIGTGSLTLATLRIEENSILTSISGLSNLVFAEQIILIDNDSLTDLTGLGGFPSDGFALRSLELRDMDGLANLTGLPSTLLAMGTLTVELSDNLTSLSGVPAMAVIGGIRIAQNNRLASLASLSVIGQLGGEFMGQPADPGTLEIIGNIMLTDLTGLPPTTVLNLLEISANGPQQALSKMSSLTAATGWNLDSLSTLAGVSGNVTITNNPLLSECSGLIQLLDDVDDGEPGPGPGLDGIPDVSGSILIQNNGAGCNSIEEILNSSNNDDDVFEDSFEEG